MDDDCGRAPLLMERGPPGPSITVEGILFLRYEVRFESVVAVFRLAAPLLEWGAYEPHWTHDLVLDRNATEARLRNLQAVGYRAEVTAAALDGWPASSADLLGEGLPAPTKQEPRDPHRGVGSPGAELRAEPRSRLIVHGRLVAGDGSLDCVIVDVSATGAQLSLAASVTAPQMALLHLSNGLVHAVQRRWQRDTLAGYAFLSDAEAGDRLVQPPAPGSAALGAERGRRWRRLSKMLGLASGATPVSASARRPQ